MNAPLFLEKRATVHIPCFFDSKMRFLFSHFNVSEVRLLLTNEEIREHHVPN